ncbi:MAG: diguanylate cyclase [Deltaproteobacteria bacterium]|nr:diguanylate cyclase [Deltaproteobacteria bacterium]
MPLIPISCVALILLALFPAGLLWAAPPVILEKNHALYELSLNLDLLEDRHKELTIAQVASPEFAARFVPNRKPLLNLGFTRSAYWLRCRIDNQSSPEPDWLLELDYVIMNRIDLYIVHADGSITAKRSGSLLPLKDRDVDFSGHLFRLTVRPQEKQMIYLRLETEGAMRAPLTLRTPQAFAEYLLNKRLVQGLSFGVFLVMVLYNIFVFFILRENNAIYYVLTLCFAVLYLSCLTGLAARFLGPDHMQWSMWGVHVGGQLAMVFLIIFSQHALKTKEVTPLVHKLLNGVIGLNIGVALATFFNFYFANITSYVVTLMGSGLLVYAGLRCWLLGQKGVRYYVGSWVLILAILVVHILGGAGFLPLSPINSTDWLVIFALAGAMLSLVLTDKYRTVQEDSQRTLEEKVSERTRELNKAVDELSYRVTFEQMVAAISTDFMASSLSPEDTDREINKVLSMIGWFCAGDQSYALVLEPQSARVKQCYQWSRSGAATSGPFSDGQGAADDLSWLVDKLRHQEAVIEMRLADLPETASKEKAFFSRLGAKSLLLAPLVYHEELLGLVGLNADPDYHHWPENDTALLKIVGQIITNALVHHRAKEEIKHLANHDSLTGLANRRFLNELFDHLRARAKRSGKQMAVFYLDLDNFKPVNDRLGHRAGDEVLRMMAQRIRSSLREMDTAARIGGDEFVIISEDLTNYLDAGIIAQKIMGQISLPCGIDGDVCHLGVSIGISIFPFDGDDLDTLIRKADAAMYRIKESGKGGYRFFEPTKYGLEKIGFQSGLEGQPDPFLA